MTSTVPLLLSLLPTTNHSTAFLFGAGRRGVDRPSNQGQQREGCTSCTTPTQGGGGEGRGVITAACSDDEAKSRRWEEDLQLEVFISFSKSKLVRQEPRRRGRTSIGAGAQ
ncbi:unnamed protein product, partial [Ectocarpus sp. 13 AM-2016]